MKLHRLLALTSLFGPVGAFAQTTGNTPPVPADFWKLDEATGTQAANSQRALHGTHRNGATPGTAGVNSLVTGSAVTYDGVDDGTELPPLNYTSNSMSLVAWVKRNGTQAAWSQFIYSRALGTDAGFGLGGSHELRYHWEGTNWQFNPSPALTVPDGQWCLAALVVQPHAATLYLRTAAGIQKAVNTAPHGVQTFAGATWIGRDGTRTTRCFKGQMDEVQIHQRALAEEDIHTIYSLGQGCGLTGAYFNGSTFTNSAAQRRDPNVNFCWGGPNVGARPEGVTDSLFSARWTGYVIPKYTETYTFQAEAGGRAQMWVNGTQILNGIPAPGATVNGTVNLTAGVPAEIRLDYAHSVAAMPSHCCLFWLSPSTPLSIVPQSRLRINSSVLPGGSVAVSTAEDTAATVTPMLLRTSLDDHPRVHRSMRMIPGAGTIMDLHWDMLASHDAYYTLECSETMRPGWQIIPRSSWTVELGQDGREYCRFRHWQPASGRNFFRLIVHPRNP